MKRYRYMSQTISKLLSLVLIVCLCGLISACSADGLNGGGEDTADQVEEEFPEEPTDEAETETEASVDNISGFSTTDLDGEAADGEIFSAKDVTVVNIWGTFCGPCIGELPDLQALSESLPENAQMIGILCDVLDADSDEYKEALRLVDENGITYRNLMLSDSMSFMENVMYVPTTMIVDSEGNVIGEPIVGADVRAYRRALEDYLAG